MGREERLRGKSLRVLEWSDDPLDVRAFAATYEAFAGYRPEKDDEDRAKELFRKFAGVGHEKNEQTGNQDLVLRSIDGAEAMVVTDWDRDLLLKAIAAIRWPVFALAKRDRAVEIIKEAAHAPEIPKAEAAGEDGGAPRSLEAVR